MRLDREGCLWVQAGGWGRLPPPMARGKAGLWLQEEQSVPWVTQPLMVHTLGGQVPPLQSGASSPTGKRSPAIFPSEALQVLPDGFLKLCYSAEITENVDS